MKISPLSDDIENLKKCISNIKPSGGGDIPEDWVEGYEIALNKMNRKNWIKLAIYIADADHRKDFFWKW